MPKEKPELSDAMRKKLSGKSTEKSQLTEQNSLLQFLVLKVELESQLLQQTLL